MKKWMILFILFAWVNNAAAQADSVYKYVYTFSPDVPDDKPYISIDSSFNPVDTSFLVDTSFEFQVLSSINGEIKNSSNELIAYPTICLYSNEKKVWCEIRPSGTFSEDVNPGVYELSAGAVGYKSLTYKFSIARQTTLHFSISLATAASLIEYEVRSIKKLNPNELKRIKKCVQGKNYSRGCSEKKSYYVSMVI